MATAPMALTAKIHENIRKQLIGSGLWIFYCYRQTVFQCGQLNCKPLMWLLLAISTLVTVALGRRLERCLVSKLRGGYPHQTFKVFVKRDFIVETRIQGNGQELIIVFWV